MDIPHFVGGYLSEEFLLSEYASVRLWGLHVERLERLYIVRAKVHIKTVPYIW